jgi:hypothetical protein
MQLGLFAPQTPEPSRLDVTLARLRAMVGEERVGSPVIEDTHRADGFRMEGFVNPGPQMRGTGGTHTNRQVSKLASLQVSEADNDGRSRMALRRVRPARVVRVTVSSAFAAKSAVRMIPHPSDKNKGVARVGHPTIKPIAFSDGENRYEIAAAYGPWKTSGCWWELSAWDTEEWDVLAVRVENLPSGAKAHNHFAEGNGVGAKAPTYQPCPDTSCSSGEIFPQFAKSCPDTKLAADHFANDGRASAGGSSKRNVLPAGERQPQILRLRPSALGSARDDKHPIGSDGATIACLLTRDRTRNAWRLEAFYD